MKSLKAIVALGAMGCILAGCGSSVDHSGDTQQMPASASAPNPSPTMPSGVPDQAKSAIGKAAPMPTGK